MSATAVSTRPVVLADLIPGGLVRDVGLVAAGAGVTGLAAQVSILTPLSPVPFTLQTLSVLLVGAALGTTRGVLSMMVYLAAGMAGVPWYADQASGWGMPSFGYVVGFVLAAAVVGSLSRRGADRGVFGTVLLMVAGNVAIYAVGTTWLALDLGVGVTGALDLGVLPFLAGDALKVIAAALVLPAAWKLLHR